MAANGWQLTTFATFQPQADKIIEIFNMGLGWEVWSQVELGVQCKRESDRNNNDGSTQLSNFEREKNVYQGTAQRCDFLCSYVIPSSGHQVHHFVELKCLIRGKLSDFVTAVEGDIDKVKLADPLDDWTVNADYVGGWVMALTVSPVGDQTVNNRMRQLATDKNIRWDYNGGGYHIATAGGNDITVWTWSKTFIGNPH